MRGYVASLTLKNYPGVDIFALNPRNNKQVAVQVKTINKPSAPPARFGQAPMGSYFLPEAIGDDPDRPFVFVTITPDCYARFFIVPNESVAAISDQERRDYFEYVRSKGRTIKDVQPRMISLQSLQPFEDKWERLGLDD